MYSENQPNNSAAERTIDSKKLSSLISAHLNKAEALVGVAATVDFELFTPDIITNYLWSLSDTIREAKKLYNLSINQNI